MRVETCVPTRPPSVGQIERWIPKGDHDVFAQFLKDPNCEVCRMTEDTKRQMQEQTSATRTFGELITVDHRILVIWATCKMTNGKTLL